MNAIRLLFRGPLACLAAAAFLFAGCVSEPATPRVVFTKLAINGQPVRMVLDTGAASTVLYNAAANRVGLNFAPPRHDVVAGAFEIVAGMSEPARVTAGAQTFTARLPVFTLPPSSRLMISSTSGEDGVIGWPEIRDNILVFDAAHRMVRSVAQLPEETSGWLKLKVRTAQHIVAGNTAAGRQSGDHSGGHRSATRGPISAGAVAGSQGRPSRSAFDCCQSFLMVHRLLRRPDNVGG